MQKKKHVGSVQKTCGNCTWSGGILVSRDTASLSLDTVLLSGTATPILMQWEYLPW